MPFFLGGGLCMGGGGTIGVSDCSCIRIPKSGIKGSILGTGNGFQHGGLAGTGPFTPTPPPPPPSRNVV